METRKIYAILLPFIIPALAYGNLVNNPSMEGNFIYQDPLGEVAEYWTAWREQQHYGSFGEGIYAHDANKSQEIHWNGYGCDDFGQHGIYQQIGSLQPGQDYRVSVWFKFRFSTYGNFVDETNITFSVGTDPNGETDPDVVTNWGSVWDYTYDTWYDGPWFNCVIFFSANDTTATLFIKASGQACADYWDAYCYIDDVNIQTIQISQDSTVTATTPVAASGYSYSKVTITVLDSASNPLEGIPTWEIDVNCTGSGNFILGPDTPSDVNGQTTARITSTVSETKTVSATVLGTILSDTAAVYFCESVHPKLLASDGAAYDHFGYSVAIDGNTALVGAYGDDVNGTYTGSAYIFRFDGSSWVQETKLLASDGAAGDRFGLSVAIDGNTALIGARGDDDNGSNSGSAYVFRYNGSSWTEQAKLLASDGAESDYSGSVSIDGNTALIGAYGNDDNGSSSGSAYIFRYDGSNWVQEAKLLASDGAASDWFGYSVAIDGNTALIGAYRDDDNGSDSGSAYIFHFDGSSWVQQAKLLPSDGAGSDYFGCSVAIDGNTALVGSYWDDDNGSKSGSAYIFTPNSIDPNNWDQHAKLLASDGAAYDYFGCSVAIDATNALIGAWHAVNNGCGSGSAYVFRFDGSSWTEQAKLLASDGAGSDYFGYSVSIAGNTALVGAYEDDDKGSGSGSVYVFPTLIGDLDSDRDVDLIDFSILANQWQQAPCKPSADIAPCGGDCIIDFLDLKVLCAHWLE